MDIGHYDVVDFVCDHSFQQYCLGQNNVACQSWAAWVQAHPEKHKIVAEAKVLFELLSARQGNIEEQLDQLKQGLLRAEDFKSQLDQLSVANAQARLRRSQMIRFGVPLGAVATAALVILIVRLWSPAEFPPTNPLPDREVAPQTVAVRKTVALPDGTLVVLADNSEILTAEGFNRANRTVYLTGQAYFDVTHRPDQPFVVMGKLTKTVVLGTAFTVSEDLRQGVAEVTLLRGKVEVRPNEHPDRVTTMLPEQRYVYRADKGTNRKQDTVMASEKEVAWINQPFTFDNDPLETIIGELSAWYGVKARFEDPSVKSYRYTGHFQSESIHDILESLQLSYPFRFRMEGDSLYIGK